MGIKEYRATGGNRALLNDYHRKSDSLAQWQINFLPDTATQIYGFDYLGSGNHGIYSGSEYYPYLSANYDLRYKSIECYKNDKVIVDFGSYPEKDSVIFKDKYGVKLKVSKGNILNFSGVTDADTNYIYAYRGDEKLGKLSVNTYKKKSYKVVLVSVNKAKLPDINELEKYLGKVYRQSVDSIEIDTAYFYFPELLSFSHGGSPWNSVYNDDQKRVLRAYDKNMKDGVYYLFFIDNVTDKKDGNGTLVSGYMPRGYNAGFIYDGGSPHTIAHELGHGIAGLEHVFENSSSSGKTQNLMDYASGTQLWHFQWDEIQDPSRVWMKWNKDESAGENVEKQIGEIISVKLTCDKGRRIQLYYDDNDNRIEYDDFNYEFDGKKKIERSFAVLKKTEISINIKFKLNTVPFSEDLSVEIVLKKKKIKNAKILSFDAKATKDSSNTYQIETIISFDDCLDYYDNINLYLFDEKEKKQLIGSTSNKIMVMGAKIEEQFDNPLYETIADIGCRNAFGQKESENIVNAIWNDFEKLEMKNANGEIMKYWGQESNPGQNISSMLKNKNGTCRAWARLFYYVLKYQGIGDIAVYHIQSKKVNEGEQIATNCFDENYLGIPFDDGASVCNYSCKGGQNNDIVPCAFKNHYVVVWNGILYDPSYGKNYKHNVNTANTIETDWEKYSIGAYININVDNKSVARPNKLNIPEVEFGKDL
jgi:hypothetical protein